MAGRIVDRVKVIDTDTHLIEPEDLWTSRVSVKKWGDLVPHVAPDPKGPRQGLPGDRYEGRTNDVWLFANEPMGRPTANNAMSEYDGFLPNHPPSLREAIPACYDAPERLKWMDTHGVYAHLLYPNVAGFGSGRYKLLKDPELMFECTRAYNDFLAEWCTAAPKRLIPLASVPFWDIAEAVREINRVFKIGHKGIIFTSMPDDFDEPPLSDSHWDPLWATCQDLGLAVNFHTISGDQTGPKQMENRRLTPPNVGRQANLANMAMKWYLQNAAAIGDVIISGVCERFPRLNFVSVESGVGWIPFTLEALDYQWVNFGVQRWEHPDRLLPSEYFRRQVYGCFWFEKDLIKPSIEQYPDNFLFETDFPHPSAQVAGPASGSEGPELYIENTFGGWDEDLVEKVLYKNAARVYHLD